MATCNPNELAKDASCFFCLPPGYYYPIKLAILARILKALDPGADTSPAGLMADAAAACIACPPQGELGPMRLALICDATGGGGAVPIPPSNLTIDLTSTDTDVIPTWTNNGGATNIEVWKSVNGGAYALYATIAGAATNYHDPAAMNLNDYWEYQVRAVGPGGNSAFSNKAGVANSLSFFGTANVFMPFLVLCLNSMSIGSPDPALLTVSFPELLKIEGLANLSINPNLTSISMPKLRTVTGSIDCSNDSSLITIDFSSLVTVGGDLLFAATSCVANFPALTSVGNIDFSNSLGASFSAQALTTAGTLTFVSAALSTALFGALTTATGMDFSGCNNLSSVSFTVLATVNGNIDFNGDPSLLGLQFPALTTVTGFFNGSETSSLATASFPSLATVGGNFIFSQSAGDGLAAWSLPALTSVGGDFTFTGTSAASLTANALTSIGGDFDILSTTNIVSISLTGLTSITGHFQTPNNPSLATISLSSITSLGNFFDVSGCGSLTTVSFPNINFPDNVIISADSCVLNQASVDLFLSRGAASPGPLMNDNFQLNSPGNSSPTGGNLNANYLFLIGNGNTVNIN